MKNAPPPWIAALAEDDIHFVRRFVLASGSLKALAGEYNVSYPTLRNRLDRLIAKIQAAEKGVEDDPFRLRIRLLVADGKLSSETARELIRAHDATLNHKEETP